jgi:predicted Zn-ribbon and HTH transcriptional regulator
VTRTDRPRIEFWVRPWVCNDCGWIEIQSEGVTHPENCARCEGDHIERAGPWQWARFKVFADQFPKVKVR